MPAKAREILHFWKAASAPQEGLREGVVGVALSGLSDDVEAIAFTTDNPVSRATANTLLDARDMDCESTSTREPFYDGVALSLA